ncbi:MAG TPA: cbb3-type cytochrome c oxidase subunit I, partial [Candidatus Nitrosotalea sp.]|nr:cbb3-type cytochrome c oxidase subunit I [Candidatus Nitrosotalea sp.]
YVLSTDHKVIAKQFVWYGLFFLGLGGLMAMMIRWQIGHPGTPFPVLGELVWPRSGGVMPPQAYTSFFTMHGTIMIFFAITPILIGAFGNFCIPLMIGARDMAFPTLNMLSFWTMIVSGAVLISSFFVPMGPASGGWQAYPTLSTLVGQPGLGQTLWVVAIFTAGSSTIMGAVNYITTVIRLRAPGMGYFQMPLTVWGLWLTAILNALFVPVIAAGMLLLFLDRVFGSHFFLAGAAITQGGGDPVLYQHLFWIFGHPEVYILILPAMGIVSEVLPTFARKPLFGAPVVIYSGIMIGFFGFGVWSHHMFAVGMGPVADSAFSITTMLIAVPTGVKILNWIGTLWGGTIRFRTPLYFALGFIAMFTMGGLSGVMHASPPVDLQQTDSYFVVAHFHYVLFGGSIFGLFGGIYYWWPKITGKLLDERLGLWHFWLMMIGFNVTFFPQHYLGLIGMPRRIYTYAPDLGWNFWNLVSTIGSFLIAVSLLFFIANVVRTMRSGQVAGSDPWDARTLEWAIPSPPPVYNFARVPHVHDRDDFWLQKHGDGHGSAPRPKPAPVTAAEIAAIHMPSTSYWPLLLALAMTVMISGLMISMYQVIVGGLLTLYLMYKFAMELHRPAEGHGH